MERTKFVVDWFVFNLPKLTEEQLKTLNDNMETLVALKKDNKRPQLFETVRNLLK